MSDSKLEIMLTEYSALKSEQNNMFVAQFTVIGIWITFLGVIISWILDVISQINSLSTLDAISQINSLSALEANKIILSLLIWILLPGVNSLLFLIWLDLATRFIKCAHYIFGIENRLKEKYPETMQWEHFLYKETKDVPLLKKTNYLYYCIMIGVMIVSYILIGILAVSFRDMCKIEWYHMIFLGFILFFTIVCTVLYVRRILLYAREKASLN
ncbi:MAG: hypothetical protein IJO60_06105 [Agathobacter sp.]|nr:hypothetical protein [Agathobacter sp.]